jgi:CysZ protein
VELLSLLRHNLIQAQASRRSWAGAWCVVQGALLCLRSPSLLALALLPVAINLLLYPVFGYLAWRMMLPVHNGLIPPGPPDHGSWGVIQSVLSWTLWGVLVVVFGLCALFLVSVVGSVLSAPFLERLTSRTEEALTRVSAPAGPGVMESLKRAAKGQALFLLAYVMALTVAAVGYAVPVVGILLGPMAQALVSVLFLALQFLEWPAERRRQGFVSRTRLVRQNLAASLGFGIACWFLMLLPFTLPFVAVGGTLLYLGLCHEGSH